MGHAGTYMCHIQSPWHHACGQKHFTHANANTDGDATNNASDDYNANSQWDRMHCLLAIMQF